MVKLCLLTLTKTLPTKEDHSLFLRIIGPLSWLNVFKFFFFNRICFPYSMISRLFFFFFFFFFGKQKTLLLKTYYYNFPSISLSLANYLYYYLSFTYNIAYKIGQFFCSFSKFNLCYKFILSFKKKKIYFITISLFMAMPTMPFAIGNHH